MAQHDMDLANGTGAAFRADANAALAALVTLSSGASEPSTRFAYMLWADTTAGLLKIRNAANNAWITVGALASAALAHRRIRFLATQTPASTAPVPTLWPAPLAARSAG